jgi:hypothetical protein
MKSIKFYLIFLISVNKLISQVLVPYNYVLDPQPYVLSNGGVVNYNALFSSPNGIINSGQNISGSSSINYVGSKIYLGPANGPKPGFAVHNLSDGSSFHALGQNSSLVDIAFVNQIDNFATYDRLEMAVKFLDNNTQQQIDNFLAGSSGLNPYDPDQVKVVVSFFNTNTNKNYDRYGFYYRDFTVVNEAWVEQNTDYKFRVRFAPPTAGLYNFNVNVYISGNLFTNFQGAFNVYNNGDWGHLKMANGNLRKMQFENGYMFFGIGQNIPYSDGLPLPNSCVDQYSCHTPSTYDQHRQYLNNLADNGGNFTRIIHNSWTYPVEWSYRQMLATDPSPSKPLSSYLNNYDVNQRYMWELDKTFTELENRGIKTIICLLQDQNYSVCSAYDWGGKDGGTPLFGWNKSPYYSILPHDLAGLKSFFTDPTAKSIFKKYLYYVMARWGYSKSLAIWEMVNETINLANASYYTRDMFFETDPSFRQDVATWMKEMKDYMEGDGNIDKYYPWHPFTSGAGTKEENSPSQNYGTLNFLNIYSDNTYRSQISTVYGEYESAEYVGRFNKAKEYFNNYKPFFWGEVGFNDNCNSIDEYDDRSFHNSNWSSIFSGAISTCMYWNDWPQKHYVNHRYNFQAIKDFVANINFSQPLEPGSTSIGSDAHTGRVNTYYMKTSDQEKVYGWGVNYSSNWTTDFYSKYNVSIQNPNNTNTDIINLRDYLLSCTGFNGIEYNYDVNTIPMGVYDLKTWARYKIKIYGTYNVWGQLQSDFNEYTDINGSLFFSRFMPNAPDNSSFYPDYAFIAEYNPIFNRTPYPDSATVAEVDTICLDGNFISNKKGNKFYWDLGNGETSQDVNPCTHYTKAGVYNIFLTIKNSGNDSVKYFSKKLVVTPNILTPSSSINIKLFPNPAQNEVNLVTDISGGSIEIYDLLGQIIFIQNLSYGGNTLKIQDLPNGVYTYKVKAENLTVKSDKIIINK